MLDIQKEIDSCAAAGGGVVTLPPGIYRCGTIRLRSGVELHLMKGAELRGSRSIADYAPPPEGFIDGAGQERGRSLIVGCGISDAAVTGEGVIDGQGDAFPDGSPDFSRRPMLLRMVNSRNIRLSGVKLRAPAAWTCHLRNCENVSVTRLDISSHANSNNDGIDIDSCRKVTVSRCRIDSGDDAVCLKSTLPSPCEDVEVTDCVLATEASAVKFGTESYGDMRRITIRRCRVDRADAGAVKILSADGAVIEDVLVSDIRIDRASAPVFIRLGSRCRVYDPELPRRETGKIRRIRVENLRGVITPRSAPIINGNFPHPTPVLGHNCLAVMGLPGHPVQQVVLRDIDLTFPGGMTAPAPEAVPDFPESYPEVGYYGVLPASCVYLKHVEDVDFSGFSPTVTAPDSRQIAFFEASSEVTFPAPAGRR